MLFTASISAITNAQVKIGGNPNIINPNAILELDSYNKGLVLPRLALVSTSSPLPLSSFSEGMLVYDTATAGDVTPGIYYSDGTKWIRIENGNIVSGSNNSWGLNGNSGTTPYNNFIGTNDNHDLVFKTNGIERMRLTKTGWIGIGTNNPQASFHTTGEMIIGNIPQGNTTTDSLLVADSAGKVKAISANNFVTGVKKTSITIIQNNQTNFLTPFAITDAEKIMLYRNGVMINFSVSGSNTITSEVACTIGDEIKIVQLL